MSSLITEQILLIWPYDSRIDKNKFHLPPTWCSNASFSRGFRIVFNSQSLLFFLFFLQLLDYRARFSFVSFARGGRTPCRTPKQKEWGGGAHATQSNGIKSNAVVHKNRFVIVAGGNTSTTMSMRTMRTLGIIDDAALRWAVVVVNGLWDLRAICWQLSLLLQLLLLPFLLFMLLLLLFLLWNWRIKQYAPSLSWAR